MQYDEYEYTYDDYYIKSSDFQADPARPERLVLYDESVKNAFADNAGHYDAQTYSGNSHDLRPRTVSAAANHNAVFNHTDGPSAHVPSSQTTGGR